MTADVTSAATPAAVQLDWSNKDGSILVTPRDQDRYMVKVRKAIDLLQKAQEQDQFRAQFQLLQRTLAEWLTKRHDVASAFVTIRDGALAFVVVQLECRHSPELEDALSDLDLRIANDVDLNLIHLNVFGLPPVSTDAMNAFLHAEFTLQLTPEDVENRGPHRPGEQK